MLQIQDDNLVYPSPWAFDRQMTGIDLKALEAIRPINMRMETTLLFLSPVTEWVKSTSADEKYVPDPLNHHNLFSYFAT